MYFVYLDKLHIHDPIVIRILRVFKDFVYIQTFYSFKLLDTIVDGASGLAMSSYQIPHSVIVQSAGTVEYNCASAE